jgi:hypothetical protein
LLAAKTGSRHIAQRWHHVSSSAAVLAAAIVDTAISFTNADGDIRALGMPFDATNAWRSVDHDQVTGTCALLKRIPGAPRLDCYRSDSLLMLVSNAIDSGRSKRLVRQLFVSSRSSTCARPLS